MYHPRDLLLRFKSSESKNLQNLLTNALPEAIDIAFVIEAKDFTNNVLF